MKKIQPLFFIGAFYELLRTGILFVLTIVFVSPELDQVKILLFVLLVSPGFVLFAGYIFLGMHTERYAETAKLLALGKIAGLLPVMIGALNSIGIVQFTTAERQLTSTGLLFGIIILFDLLFFLFLVSYNRRADRQPEKANQELPTIEEVEIEE